MLGVYGIRLDHFVSLLIIFFIFVNVELMRSWKVELSFFTHSNYRVIFLYDLQMEKKADWLLKLAFWNAILCMKQWQAVVFPLSLTSLMYAGSFVFKSLLLVDSWKEHMHQGEGFFFDFVKAILQNFLAGLSSTASNVLAWRNYVVVSLFINRSKISSFKDNIGHGCLCTLTKWLSIAIKVMDFHFLWGSLDPYQARISPPSIFYLPTIPFTSYSTLCYVLEWRVKNVCFLLYFYLCS